MEVWEILVYGLLLILLWGLAVFQIYVYCTENFGKYALAYRAFEAADEGDTKKLLRLLKRMREKAQKNPACPTPESCASYLVFEACEWEYPQTAQAVLDYLGMERGELMWEEEGKEAIPLLEFVRREGVTCTQAFLTQEPEPHS